MTYESAAGTADTCKPAICWPSNGCGWLGSSKVTVQAGTEGFTGEMIIVRILWRK